MSSPEFCVIQLQGWSEWWQQARQFRLQMYISIVLFFLSAALAYPIARTVFFVQRRATPKRWVWPDEARVLMMWQTALLCRAGLLWIALRVSRLSVFLCQWPSWLFGICLIIWMDSIGNVLREVIVRKGIKGYSDDEKPGRITLLYEGTTLAKMMLLVLVVYTWYIASFVQNDKSLRAVSSIGFFLAIALSLLPLLRNIVGAHYMFLNNMLRLSSRVQLHKGVSGTIKDAPLGFLVVETAEKSRAFVPAGGSVTTATAVYSDEMSILCLDISLAFETLPSDVRAFVQELDRLAVRCSEMGYLVEERQVGSPSNSPRIPDRLPLAWDSQPKNTLTQVETHQHIIKLSTRQRWIIHFKAYVPASSDVAFEELRSSYIEQIMQLKETWLETRKLRGV